MRQRKILVVLGPTAIGKTDLAVILAQKFHGELVACDSRQIFKGLKIGAGKGKEQVWLYDVADPKRRYSVSEYVRDAIKVIDDVSSRGKLPIVVGGTYLYLRGLLGDIPLIHIKPDQKLRQVLERLSVEELQRRVVVLSPTDFEKMTNSDKQNKRRLIRKIEILNMNPYNDTINPSFNTFINSKNVLKIGLTAPRPVLNSLIDARVLSRLSAGMVKEAEDLHKNGLSFERMRELGLEYRILANFLEQKITNQEMVGIMQTKIHQYSKRQMTFFKKDSEILWFDITEANWQERVEKGVRAWYNTFDD